MLVRSPSWGDVAAMQQDWARARLLYEESLTEAKAASDMVEIASCLEGVAGVVAAGRGIACQCPVGGTTLGSGRGLARDDGSTSPTC